MGISLQLNRFFRQKEERFHGSYNVVAWFETSWNVILVSHHCFSNAYKMRGGRSCGWALRRSTVPGVFVCLCSEGLCCFCIRHASAVFLGDIYEKQCALDSSGITFCCRDMKHSEGDLPLLLCVQCLAGTLASSSCLLINWPGSPKTWLLLSVSFSWPHKHCKCAWMEDMYGGDTGCMVGVWRRDGSTAPQSSPSRSLTVSWSLDEY